MSNEAYRKLAQAIVDGGVVEPAPVQLELDLMKSVKTVNGQVSQDAVVVVTGIQGRAVSN